MCENERYYSNRLIKGVTYMLEKVCKMIALYKSMFVKKEDLYVFGSWWGNKFADNPKFLYLNFLKKGLNAVWITKSEEIFVSMSRKRLPVLMAGSKEGIACCQKAKFAFFCTSIEDIDEYHIGGAYLINLNHGIPLKKIVYDDTVNNSHRTLKVRARSFLTAIPYRKSYIVSTSEKISKIYTSAYRKDMNHILQWGQPRNDCMFDGTLKHIQYEDVTYDKLILYMPTHRNEGATEIKINEILDLKRLNTFCEENNVIFVIKKHYYHRDELTDMKGYSRIFDYTQTVCDTQELLYNADVLITDYSSCYIDYLLLDRPILFYSYDLDNYLENDREMYFDYEEVTPGPKVVDFDSFMNCLSDLQNGFDTYKGERARVKRIFYSPDNDGPVSTKIIKSLFKLEGKDGDV